MEERQASSPQHTHYTHLTLHLHGNKANLTSGTHTTHLTPGLHGYKANTHYTPHPRPAWVHPWHTRYTPHPRPAWVHPWHTLHTSPQACMGTPLAHTLHTSPPGLHGYTPGTHTTHLIHQHYFFLVRYFLWLGELVEPSPWLEDQSVVLDERTNVTSLVHI